MSRALIVGLSFRPGARPDYGQLSERVCASPAQCIAMRDDPYRIYSNVGDIRPRLPRKECGGKTVTSAAQVVNQL
jgi:hypothetical protein